MAYNTPVIAHGNEGGDITAEKADTNVGLSGVDLSIDSTRSQTGTKSLLFNMAANSKNGWALTGLPAAALSSPSIIVVSGGYGVSAAPSTALPLLSTSFGAASGEQYCRVETDRAIAFYTKNGLRVGPKSATLIPTAGLQELVVVFDGLTQNGNRLFIKVYMGDAEELSFDTGLSWSDFFNTARGLVWGDGTPAGSNFGANLYGDDLIAAYSTAAADAPHLVAYARYRITGGDLIPPAVNATYTAWTSDFTSVDELGAHDVDVTFIDDTVVNDKETYQYTAANPVPVGATVAWVMRRGVAKLEGAGKAWALFLHRLGGVDQTDSVSTGGTTYTDMFKFAITRPGGGAWVQADFDLSGGNSLLQFGVQTPGSGTVGCRVTKLCGPEPIYYTDTLPTGQAPHSGASVFLRGRPLELEIVDLPRVELDPLPFPGLFAAAAAAVRRRLPQVA